MASSDGIRASSPWERGTVVAAQGGEWRVGEPEMRDAAGDVVVSSVVDVGDGGEVQGRRMGDMVAAGGIPGVRGEMDEGF